jgi:hypothetical protein
MLSRAVKAGFNPALGAADDGTDVTVGKPFVMMEDQRGLEIVGQAINRRPDRCASFVVFQRRIGRQAIGRHNLMG